MEEFIRHGTPAFRRANLALFAAGVATFSLLYCVQPLLPEFSRCFGVGAAASSLSLSSTSAAIGASGLAAGAVFARSLPPAAHFVSHPLHFAGSIRRYAAPWRDRGLPWLIIEGFLLLGGFVTVYNYIGYRLMAPPYRLSQSAVGMIFSVYVVGTISSTWIGHLAGRLGRRRVLWTMFMLMLAGVALTLSGSLWLIIAGIAVSTFGFFGGHSIASSWVGRRAGAAKAQAASLYLFSYYLGSSIAGTAGGFFYAAHGWRGVAAFVATLWGAGLLIAWRLYHLPPLSGSGAAPETEPAMP